MAVVSLVEMKLSSLNHAYLIATPNPKLAKEQIDQLITMFIAKQNSEKYHPDIFQIVPGTKSIGINQVKELKIWLALKPYQANYKLAVIWQAQKLTTEAQNALLKTLEEPPESSIIILAATNYQLLLPTIVSRCQLIFLGGETSQPENDFDSIVEILNLDLAQKFALAEEVVDNPHDFLINQALFWHQLLLLKLGFEKTRLESKTKRLLSQLSIDGICQFLKNIQSTSELIEQNINTRLAIDVLLMNAPSPAPAQA